jgi:hypothetical protein
MTNLLVAHMPDVYIYKDIVYQSENSFIACILDLHIFLIASMHQAKVRWSVGSGIRHFCLHSI